MFDDDSRWGGGARDRHDDPRDVESRDREPVDPRDACSRTTSIYPAPMNASVSMIGIANTVCASRRRARYHSVPKSRGSTRTLSEWLNAVVEFARDPVYVTTVPGVGKANGGKAGWARCRPWCGRGGACLSQRRDRGPSMNTDLASTEHVPDKSYPVASQPSTIRRSARPSPTRV